MVKGLCITSHFQWHFHLISAIDVAVWLLSHTSFKCISLVLHFIALINFQGPNTSIAVN